MSTSRLRRTAAGLALAVVASLGTALSGPGLAQANPLTPEPPRPAFYEPPAQLPDANGALIRSQSTVVGPGNQPYDTTLMLYRSTTGSGQATAVSGIVFVPKTPWTGPGPRPIIGFAPGTQGLADRCAPSRQFVDGIEYEGIFIDPLLKAGYAIAMTDYVGLGTPGVHTYMTRVDQGRAVLDGVRAAQQLPGLSPLAPVGVQGYSQGGSGAAAAAELAPTYAPELNLKGAAVGAPGANLFAVAKNLDGSHFAAFLLFATRGIGEASGIDASQFLNDKGMAMYAKAEQDCVYDLFSYLWMKSNTLTKTGEDASAMISREPLRSAIDAQTLGRIKPQVPIMITHSIFDDALPFVQGRQLGRDYCSLGAKVQFNAVMDLGHLGGMFPASAKAIPFWKARFAGAPFYGNCGWF